MARKSYFRAETVAEPSFPPPEILLHAPPPPPPPPPPPLSLLETGVASFLFQGVFLCFHRFYLSLIKSPLVLVLDLAPFPFSCRCSACQRCRCLPFQLECRRIDLPAKLMLIGFGALFTILVPRSLGASFASSPFDPIIFCPGAFVYGCPWRPPINGVVLRPPLPHNSGSFRIKTLAIEAIEGLTPSRVCVLRHWNHIFLLA